MLLVIVLVIVLVTVLLVQYQGAAVQRGGLLLQPRSGYCSNVNNRGRKQIVPSSSSVLGCDSGSANTLKSFGYSLQGGAVRGGVQWIGVALHDKLVDNIIEITTPCFHCTPLWWILIIALNRNNNSPCKRLDVWLWSSRDRGHGPWTKIRSAHVIIHAVVHAYARMPSTHWSVGEEGRSVHQSLLQCSRSLRHGSNEVRQQASRNRSEAALYSWPSQPARTERLVPKPERQH